MKKKGWIGFSIGFVFCLLMAMPSSILADVTVSGGTESSMVDLEGINNGTVTPGPFTTQSGTTRNAYITDTGSVSTSDSAALLTNANGWNVNVSDGGSLQGNNFGVLFDANDDSPFFSGTLTNRGSIYGGDDGVLLGAGTITNYHTIGGGGNGIYFYNVDGGTATVTNSGNITGGTLNGIFMAGESTLTARIQNNTGGEIHGSYNGISFLSDGDANVQITNAGTIIGDYLNGIYISSGGGLSATVTNNAGGSITSNDTSSSEEAVYIGGSGTGTATVNNYGNIYTYDDYGSGDAVSIYDVGSATVNNYASGRIYSYDNNGIQIETVGTAVVNNSGSIEGYWYDGIYIENAGTVNVTNSGRIYSYDYDGVGIFGADTVTVTNNAGGTIEGWSGVWIEDAGMVNISNAGGIHSLYNGILVKNVTGAVTLNNNVGGTITGWDGIWIEDVGTIGINNFGSIRGDTLGDVWDTHGIAISNSDAATVTNFGSISGYAYIEGLGAYGIYISDSDTATVINSGSVSASGDYDGDYTGISISKVETATVTNNAGGQIYGYNGNGIDMQDMDSATVNNSGLIQAYYDGIFIGYTDTAKVTNNAGGSIWSSDGRGVAMEYIGGPVTAEVTNSGVIQAWEEGVFIAESETAKVTNNQGGLIQSFNDYGVGIVDIYGTADVKNTGTIQAYMSGVGISNVYGAVTVTNNETGVIQGGILSGDDDDDDMYFPPSGVGILRVGTAEVTNKGTIQGVFAGVAAYFAGSSDDDDDLILDDDDDMILGDDDDDISGSITVTNSGTIQGGYLGVGAGFADEVTVINEAGGTIQQMPGMGMDEGFGVGVMFVRDKVTIQNAGTISGYRDGVGIAYVDGDVDITNQAGGVITGIDANGIGIVDVTDTVAVQNAGTISGYDNGVYIEYVGIAEVTNQTGGLITGTNQNGIGIFYADVAEVTNSGLIQATGEGSIGVRIVYADEGYLTNQTGGLIQGGFAGVSVEEVSSPVIENYGAISGYYGIYAPSGNTTIDNYGTVTGTGGTAIWVQGDNNFVTLHTGSVINGKIIANNSYTENHIILDGEGTINANQMEQFAYLHKTGAGTWVLTGDMDFSWSYDYNTHQMNIEEGTLALAERGSSGGAGVVTDYYTQNEGASLGYVVTATGLTGALTVMQSAEFNDGQIIVMPKAGTYAEETLYPNVLNLSNADGFHYWGSVTSTSAFLSPSIIDMESDYNFDLVLERLSFATGMPESLWGFASVLDALYDTATGDMRTFLDELLVLSPEDAAQGMASASGGSQTAMQLISVNGLGKYLGVINNHLSGGISFAKNSAKSAGASAYPYMTQVALAGGGESLSDATPLLLAAVGSIGQGQVASGTNWGLWVDGYFSYGDRRSDDIITKYNQKLYGGMLGFDFRVTDNLFFGVSGGISTADLNFDDLEDEGKMTSYQGSIYACYNGMPWYAAGIFTFAYNNYDFDRYISFAPGLVAKSDYDGKEYVGYGEVGYKFNAGGVIIRPSVAFQVDYLTVDEFTETGAGMYNLAYDEQTIGSYQSFLGLNISGPIKLGASAVLTPELRLKWAHEFSNDENMIKARLAGSGSGSSWWSVEAETLSRDSAVIGVGMNLKFNKNLAAYIQYDAQLNSDLITHTGLVGLRFEW
jgi:uncharacterized protein YhjY with autotransporter beta-barrel domain